MAPLSDQPSRLTEEIPPRVALAQTALLSFSFRGKSLQSARFCSWPQKNCGSQRLRRHRSEEAPPTEIPTEKGAEK